MDTENSEEVHGKVKKEDVVEAAPTGSGAAKSEAVLEARC